MSHSLVPYLSNCPVDITIHILSYLPLKSLISIKRLNKSFYWVVSKYFKYVVSKQTIKDLDPFNLVLGSLDHTLSLETVVGLANPFCFLCEKVGKRVIGLCFILGKLILFNCALSLVLLLKN